jgi:hypothetical protein
MAGRVSKCCPCPAGKPAAQPVEPSLPPADATSSQPANLQPAPPPAVTRPPLSLDRRRTLDPSDTRLPPQQVQIVGNIGICFYWTRSYKKDDETLLNLTGALSCCSGDKVIMQNGGKEDNVYN